VVPAAPEPSNAAQTKVLAAEQRGLEAAAIGELEIIGAVEVTAKSKIAMMVNAAIRLTENDVSFMVQPRRRDWPRIPQRQRIHVSMRQQS
jgi:hypothetical protein